MTIRAHRIYKTHSLCALVLLLAFTAFAREPIPAPPKIERARDLGIPFDGTPGKFNAISDVPGVEVGYLLQGTLTVEKEGGKTETIKTGEALDNANNGAHTATNKGTTPVKTLAVWVVQKDKPLAEPVK